ncbi:MAG TPA: hypothetical protein VFY90_10400 [Tepidiformaceae bacterium]|nr:hypothetical protein [Tepidiformaceae bacterium]
MNARLAQLATIAPFARSASAEILEARAGHARLRFDFFHELVDDNNGLLKPAALLGIGKATSAASILSLLGDRAGGASFTLASATARYSRPPRGALIAEADLYGFQGATLQHLDKAGSSTIRARVTIEDDSERPVAEIVLEWQIHLSSTKVRAAA